MMEVISKWNCRSLTDSIWESLWVPVEKGLPEPPTACLVLLRMGNNDPEGLETVASWEHGAWHIYDQDLLHLPVTHYIPLSSDGMVNGVAA